VLALFAETVREFYRVLPSREKDKVNDEDHNGKNAVPHKLLST
jgi:hypothetical protein